MILWVGLNAFILVNRGRTFDPYPYILLNLFLSMLAAIQAPVILCPRIGTQRGTGSTLNTTMR